MLQQIGERIRGWIAIVIIALVGGAFVFWGIEFYFERGAESQNVAATVNGVKISKNQLQQDTSDFQQQQIAANGGKPLSSMAQQQLKAFVLQNLVTNAAVLTTLQKDGFVVGLDQIKMMIATTPDFQVNGRFSESRFQQALMRAGLTPAAFIQRVHTQWMITQLNTALMGSAFALPNEVRALYRVLLQSRSFGYALIPVAQFAKTDRVTEKQLMNFYNQNKSAFETPMKVRVQYLLLSPKAIAQSVTVNEQSAQQFYNENIANFQRPARYKIATYSLPVKKESNQAALADLNKQADQAHTLLEQGEAVAAVNKKLSIDLTVAPSTISEIQLPLKLRDILSKLKAGEWSKPVRTSAGYTIFHLEEKYPAETKSFESVKKTITAQLKMQKISKILAKKSSELTNLTYTNPDSLKAAAKATGLSIQESGWLAQGGPQAGVFSNAKLIRAIFSDNVLKDGNNSDPVSLSNSEQIVVRVIAKQPSKLLPFDEVKSKIKAQLVAKEAEGQAGLLAYQLQTKARQGASLGDMAKEHQLKWVTVPMMQMSDKNIKHIPVPVLQKAFSLPAKEAANKKSVAVGTARLQNGDYAVVAVDHITLGRVKGMSVTKEKALAQKLSKLWGGMLKSSFIQSVVSGAKVEIHH